MTTFRYRLRWIALLSMAVPFAFQTPLTAQKVDWQADELASPFPAALSEPQLIEQLRSSTPEGKAVACKQLSIYGSKDAVPELAKLLSDPQLSSWSRIALEAIPDPSADEALVEAAKKLTGDLLVGTINSLGARRSPQAIDVLAERLSEADEDVASAAAVALGKIGGSPAVHALHQAYERASPAVRSAIAEGGILCAERFLAEGERDKAVEVYDLVRSADVPEQRILEATRGAILARGPQGIPLLVEQLKSPDKKRFQFALSTARELSGADVTAALTAQMSAAAPERAALIVVALGDQKGAALPPAVLQAARKGDEQVRLAAIGVVGRLGDVSSVSSLLEIAADSDAELSQAAKSALAGLPGKKVDADIASRLSAAKGKSQVVLIELVGARRINAIADLVKALNHRDKAIRSAALTALGATAGPKDLKILISQVIDGKNAADKEFAERALQTASIRMPDREATAAELAAAMPRARAATKASMLKILGAMGGPNALESIAAAANAGDGELQDVGTRVLGEWSTPDAAPHLHKIAGSDHKFKTRALRGYLRIARQLDLPDDQRIDMCRKALKLAERAEERKLALDALKKCPSAESVELASALIDDADVRDNAVEVAIFIGEKIKDTDPAAAKSAGEKALEAAPQGELADRARALSSP